MGKKGDAFEDYDTNWDGRGGGTKGGDGSPSTQDIDKWTGEGRGVGTQQSDGGPYGNSDLGFTRE